LPGYTRADLEANIKTLNKWVLCSYPLPNSASGVGNTNAEDQCRRVATLDEWQGGAADIIKAAYGGDGLPNATYVDNYIPASWEGAGETSLYLNVVQPVCRMCHILRGTGRTGTGIGFGGNNDADFSTFDSFKSTAADIKMHVTDVGNMPLTKVLYSRFWATPSMYNSLNSFLQNEGYTVTDASGAPLKPGRPIAVAGPDRVVSTLEPATLSAAGSYYADRFTWTIVSNPGNAATLSSTTGVQTTLTVTAPTAAGGQLYGVQLIASKGNVNSDPVILAIAASSVPDTASTPLPSKIRFSHIKTILAQGTCITCHSPTSISIPQPPIMYGDIDRDRDGVVASAVNGTDDVWFYNELKGRINFADIEGSPLLRKPAGHHHGGGGLPQLGFGNVASGVAAEQLPPGDVQRANFNVLLNWILNGAPY
jgi:mono/diheme cytochrome c family protein